MRSSELRAVLLVLGAMHEATGPAQFAQVLMGSLMALVPCDLVSYNEINLVGGATRTIFEPALVPRDELQEAFARLVEEHPLVSEYTRTGDPAPRRMSDFVTLPTLRRLDLYHEVFRPLETNYQLAVAVAASSGAVIGIGLNRRGSDFTQRHLAVLAALQPHLPGAYEHAALREQQAAQLRQASATAQVLAVLTPRERDVASLVAGGAGNRRIARTLLISERTAEKHVANLMHKLDVAGRTEVALLLAPVLHPTPVLHATPAVSSSAIG